MSVGRLNHAVLYVRDAQVAAAFYRDVLGFDVAYDLGSAVFLRAAGSENDHDLGLFSVGDSARTSAAGRGTVGLYHLAWGVSSLAELKGLAGRLQEVGALVGSSDHGVSKSLYGRDPDGIEFELCWIVPLDRVDEDDTAIGTVPLDLDAEIDRYGATTTSRIA